MSQPQRTIRTRVPAQLAARMARIAIKRTTSTKSVPVLVQEACVNLVDQQERELKLDPITPGEVDELLNGKHEEAKAA